MDIKDYQKLGGYQYAYETVTVIKQETIKPGEYFILDFSKTSLRSNTLNAKISIRFYKKLPRGCTN